MQKFTPAEKPVNMVLQAVAIVVVYQVSPVLSSLKDIKKRGKFSWCTAWSSEWQSSRRYYTSLWLKVWKIFKSVHLSILYKAT